MGPGFPLKGITLDAVTTGLYHGNDVRRSSFFRMQYPVSWELSHHVVFAQNCLKLAVHCR